MNIDEQIAEAEKRLRERTNRRAGQMLRHLRDRILIDRITFNRSLTAALHPWLARRDADEMIAGKITDPLQ